VTDGRACDDCRGDGNRTRRPLRTAAGDGARAGPWYALQRPDNEVSRRVPAVSRCKYSNRICKTAYSQGFPAFVPVVPVVPAQNGRCRKKKPCNRRARRGAGRVCFAPEKDQGKATRQRGGRLRVLPVIQASGSFAPHSSARRRPGHKVKWNWSKSE
jgi:hypothetical protein